MILKIALMSYSFIPSKCFLPGGQLNFQSGGCTDSLTCVPSDDAVHSSLPDRAYEPLTFNNTTEDGNGHFLLSHQNPDG